jgi:hypothetical protein
MVQYLNKLKIMKKTIYITLVIAFVAFSAGCKKGFLSELSNNPNQPSDAPVQLLLPPVLTGLANSEIGYNTTVGMWMGYGSFAGGYSISDNTLTYYVNQGSPSIWGLYDVLKNADYIEKKAGEEENMDYFVAVAKILKAFGFQKLVDAYGDVPYSQAFLGVGNFFPSYDNGQSIYDASIAQLDTAIALIQNADEAKAINLGDNDIMYGGDMNDWLLFANTVKLKMLIRESAVVGDAGKAELAKTADIGFITEDANVNPGYLNTAGKQSPLWASFGVDPGGSLYSDGYKYVRAGGAGLDFLKSNNDPRLFYIYSPIGGVAPNQSEYSDVDDDPSHYIGVNYGDRKTATTLTTNGTSGIGHGVMPSYDQSVALISASQSYFLQAEAALKNWLDDEAQDLYESGITASFESLGVEDADDAAEAYYSQPKNRVSWEASTNKLEAIITQKWIANAYTHSFESWSEYRRTGFPNTNVLPLTMFAGYDRHIPTIWWYPKSESDTNQENYKAAGGPSTDPQNQKVFWDKN